MGFYKKTLSKYASMIDFRHFLIFLVFLYVFFSTALGPHPFFRNFYEIPCLVFFAVAIMHPSARRIKKTFLIMPLLMMAWFIFLQFKQASEPFAIYSFSSFFCIYLFAFPLVFLLDDGQKNFCLKLFLFAFIPACLCLSGVTFLLLINCLPSFLAEHAFWDGARLHPFWHSNMAACLLMFGITASLAFLQEIKHKWFRFALLGIILLQLATMALTNCRTAILLTGGIIGGTVFFNIVQNRLKLFIPGLLAACAVIVLVFTGSSQLYQAHHTSLLNKYTVQYDHSMDTTNDTTGETSPIYANDATGEIALKTASSQKSLVEDLTSLNSRTDIWKSTLHAIQEDNSILLFGAASPGDYISQHTSYQVVHAHNAWFECLLGMGIPGFLIAMIFTLCALWNSCMVLLQQSQDIWKRTIALLVLCLMVAALMEPYLFLTLSDYHIFNFVFFLCIGYLSHWQKGSNQKLWQNFKKSLHI